MARPSIIVTPYPRTVDETFDAAAWAELNGLADVRWGRDEPIPEQELARALGDATALAFGSWEWSTEVLHSAGPGLAAVFEMLGTHDHPGLDYELCFERGIPVGSIAPAFGPVVAEMCLALALDAARGVSTSDRGFRNGTEKYLHAGTVGSISLIGRTVGFVGCGSISRTLQALLEPFEVDILGYDPWLGQDALARRGIESVGPEDLFGRSQVVFLLAVPTPANRGMIDDRLMALLDPSDILVVASRAHVVDFDALTAHLLAGHFRAGIDVFPEEPLAPDHPVREADGATLTAHLAGALPEALQDIGRMVVADLRAIIGGAPARRMQYATPDLVRSLRDRA